MKYLMSNTNKFKRLSRTLKVRLICSFLSRIASNSLIPFIVLLLSDYYGVVSAGVIMICNVSIQPISSFIGGRFSDSYSRKTIIMISQIGSCITYFFMFLFSGTNIFVIIFLLNSIFVSLGSAAMDATVLDLVNEDNKGFVLTIDYWIYNFSSIIGLIIGSSFYSFGNSFIMLLLFSIALFTSLMYGKFLPKSVAIKRDLGTKRKLFTFHKDKRWILFLIATLLILSSEFTLIYTAGIRIAKIKQFSLFGVPIKGVGFKALLQIINALIVIIFTFPLNNLFRKNKKTIIFISTIMYILSYALISVINLPIFLIIAIIIASFSELIFTPGYKILQSNIIPAEKRGEYLATYSMVIQTMGIVASLEMIVGRYTNYFISGLLIAVLGIIGVIILWRLEDNYVNCNTR